MPARWQPGKSTASIQPFRVEVGLRMLDERVDMHAGIIRRGVAAALQHSTNFAMGLVHQGRGLSRSAPAALPGIRCSSLDDLEMAAARRARGLRPAERSRRSSAVCRSCPGRRRRTDPALPRDVLHRLGSGPEGPCPPVLACVDRDHVGHRDHQRIRGTAETGLEVMKSLAIRSWPVASGERFSIILAVARVNRRHPGARPPAWREGVKPGSTHHSQMARNRYGLVETVLIGLRWRAMPGGAAWLTQVSGGQRRMTFRRVSASMNPLTAEDASGVSKRRRLWAVSMP